MCFLDSSIGFIGKFFRNVNFNLVSEKFRIGFKKSFLIFCLGGFDV